MRDIDNKHWCKIFIYDFWIILKLKLHISKIKEDNIFEDFTYRFYILLLLDFKKGERNLGNRSAVQYRSRVYLVIK